MLQEKNNGQMGIEVEDRRTTNKFPKKFLIPPPNRAPIQELLYVLL
jgi:hypothetical protein